MANNLRMRRSGARTGVYRRYGYHSCPACGLPFIAGRNYAPTCHDRPFVGGRARHWDDDLELESLVAGVPVVIGPCHTERRVSGAA